MTRSTDDDADRQTVTEASGGSADATNPANPRTYTTFNSGNASSSWGEVAIEDAGIRAGEIIAYRAWILRERGPCRGLLDSMFAAYTWRPGQIASGDNLYFHGVHAFKTLEQATDHYRSYGCEFHVVFGEVALWGTVVEHEKGYRSEFAKITKILNVMHDYGEFWEAITGRKVLRILYELRTRYGV